MNTSQKKITKEMLGRTFTIKEENQMVNWLNLYYYANTPIIPVYKSGYLYLKFIGPKETIQYWEEKVEKYYMYGYHTFNIMLFTFLTTRKSVFYPMIALNEKYVQ
jgi:hypothetical protein